VTVDITKVEAERPLNAEEMTTYLLSNLTDNTDIHVLLGGDPDAPKAIVALKLQPQANQGQKK
jgi:hypothetical protein